ncbi:MAG: cobaltochelatase CobT-related protein [Alphaproteobacteria bacterium]
MKTKNRFKKFEDATAATFRVLAEDEKLSVNFSDDMVERASNDILDLPKLAGKNPDYTYVRYLTDIAALEKRWNNEQIYKHYRPQSHNARNVYEALNTTRLIGKASKRWRGVYNNYMHYSLLEGESLNLLNNPNLNLSGRSLGVSLAILQHLGCEIPEALVKQASAWHEQIKEQLPNQEDLTKLLDDQSLWAKGLQDIIKNVCPEEKDFEKEEKEQTIQKPDNIGGNQGQDQENDAPLEGRASDRAGEGEEVADEAQAQKQGDMGEDFDGQAAEHDTADGSESIKAQLAYRVFTTQYDVVENAYNLASIAELEKLRIKLNEQTKNMQNIINRLANKLQRHLMAQQKRFWQFDLEDGILDSARLARVIAAPTHSLAYKAETENPLRHTVVSLLIDNSGSMRGQPIAMAAIIVEILARTLERCGIPVEILGFTTKHWRGGESRKLWEQAGSPKAPGRLNDLLHIIYKSADQSYRRAHLPIALMLKDGILKENIDGEAIRWAASRLYQRQEQRKILLVLSDGAPVDDATLGENEPDILYRDLTNVVQQIERQNDIELMAFGIGHDVTDIYSHAITLSTISELAETLFSQMIDLFKEQSPKKA